MSVRRALGAAVLAGLMMLPTACGGSSSSSGSAPPASPAAATPSASAPVAGAAPVGASGSLCDKGKAYQAQILALERQEALGSQSSFRAYKLHLARVFATISHDLTVLASQVPSSLQGDLAVVRAAYARLAADIAGATSLQRMATSVAALGRNVKLREAGERLSAWVQTKCPSS